MRNVFFLYIYKSPFQINHFFLDSISKIIDHQSDLHNNHIAVVDFNLEPSHTLLSGSMGSHNLGDTDVFKTSSGRGKKVMKSYDQTKRRDDVWKKMSDLSRLEDVCKTISVGVSI